MNRPALLLLVLAFPAAALAAPDPAAVYAAKTRLQAGVNENRVDEILGARADFEKLAAADAKITLLPYWVAVADWRVTAMLQRSNPKLARATCDHGLAAIDRALALNARLADAVALRAGLLALSLGLPGAPDLMSTGMQMESLFQRAATLDSLSPTVRFLDGLITLYKPAFVGGGPDHALPKLRRAIVAYQNQRPGSPLTPDWGHDDACLWAGRAALKLGDARGAKALYEQALGANPDNRWVRSKLIPEVDSVLAARAGAAR